MGADADHDVATYVLGSIAGSDLAVRFLPELFGLGDTFAVPIGAVLTARLLLHWGTLGWLLSWLLLGAVLFQLAPITLPRAEREWAHGLPGRFAFAAGGVTLGLFLEKVLLERTGLGQSPFPYPMEYAPVAVAGVVALVVVARFLPPMQLGGSLLYTFDESDYPIERAAGVSFVSQYLLLLAVVALMLAEISLLFPLPELLILGVSVHDVLEYRLRSVPQIPARRELTERVVIGAAAIWSGIRGSLWLLYNVAGLLLVILVDILYVRGIQLGRMLSIQPLDAAFVVFVLVAATGLATVSIVRLIERIPVQLAGSITGDSTPVRVDDGPDHDYPRPHVPDGDLNAHVFRDLPRIPGFLIPAGLLLGALEMALPNQGFQPFETVPVLEMTPPLVTIAVAAAAVGALTVLRPTWFPGVPVSDYYAGPMAVTFLLLLMAGSDTIARVPLTDPLAFLVWAVRLVLAYVILLSPFLGFELFTDAGMDIATNIVDNVTGGLVLLLVYGFMGAIGKLLYDGLSLSPPQWVVSLGEAVVVVPFVLLVAAVGVRLLFAPFYLPEILDEYL